MLAKQLKGYTGAALIKRWVGVANPRFANPGGPGDPDIST